MLGTEQSKHKSNTISYIHMRPTHNEMFLNSCLRASPTELFILPTKKYKKMTIYFTYPLFHAPFQPLSIIYPSSCQPYKHLIFYPRMHHKHESRSPLPTMRRRQTARVHFSGRISRSAFYRCDHLLFVNTTPWLKIILG